MFDKLKQFLKEVKIEIKKVSWPNRQEVTASTVIVMVTVLLISVFIGLSDFILTKLFHMVLR